MTEMYPPTCQPDAPDWCIRTTSGNCPHDPSTLFTRTRSGSPAGSSRLVSCCVGVGDLSEPRREEAGWERGFGEANMDLAGPDVAALSSSPSVHHRRGDSCSGAQVKSGVPNIPTIPAHPAVSSWPPFLCFLFGRTEFPVTKAAVSLRPCGLPSGCPAARGPSGTPLATWLWLRS